MRRFLLLTGGVLLLSLVALVTWSEVIVADVAEPPFDAVREDGAFAVRRYAPMIVAAVTVEGDRGTAASRGFRLLADYIFGGNSPSEKIAMTAPVLQEPEGEQIAMTAPVLQEPAGASAWVVRFVMPAGYTMETLPKPNDDRVRLSEVPARTMAAVRFTGFNTQTRLNEKTDELRRWMAANDLDAAGPPRFAFYDPPWTLPFLRRNEVLVPLAEPR